MSVAAIAAVLAVVTGCAAGFEDEDGFEEDEVGTQYVLISAFAGIDSFAWYQQMHRLNAEFDAACGDTFCEGEYTNLVPLTINCAVSSIRGSVRDCVWTFAAADTGVDATTAAIGVDAPTFQCHFRPRTSARNLLATLAAADDALHAPVPGLEDSIYDAIGECFEQPIGSTPVTVASSPTGTYVSAWSYYASSAGMDRWRAAVDGLVADFDRICGDTFCGGDYSDLHAVRLDCAITRSTGNVKSCAWVFGGSYVLPSSAGAAVATTRSVACPITMRGTLHQLITTLTATDAADGPLWRPLPGTTATAYDALLSCLP